MAAPLGVVPDDVSPEAIAFAQQSFKAPFVNAKLLTTAENVKLYQNVLKGIAGNVKTTEGGFKATSGVTLPYYLNLSTNFMDNAVSRPLVKLVTEALLEMHAAMFPDSNGTEERIPIVGMEVGGGMLVSQLACTGDERLDSKFEFVFMRKTRKTTGTAQQLEGKRKFTERTKDSAPLNCIWLDDANSTGSSLCEGCAVLGEDYNMNIIGAFYVVDRSADRAALETKRQKLSHDRFVSGQTRIFALMDLKEVDEIFNIKK